MNTSEWEKIPGIYLHCLDCHIWGIPLPNDRICGNCGKDFNTTRYFPESTVKEAIESARKEEREKINDKWLSLELRYVEDREIINRNLEDFSFFMQSLIEPKE